MFTNIRERAVVVSVYFGGLCWEKVLDYDVTHGADNSSATNDLIKLQNTEFDNRTVI